MSRKKLTIGILVLVICVLGLLAMGMLLWQNTVASEQAKKDRGFMGFCSLIGMSQVMTNVTGDAVVTTIVAKWEKAIDLDRFGK